MFDGNEVSPHPNTLSSCKFESFAILFAVDFYFLSKRDNINIFIFYVISDTGEMISAFFQIVFYF